MHTHVPFVFIECGSLAKVGSYLVILSFKVEFRKLLLFVCVCNMLMMYEWSLSSMKDRRPSNWVCFSKISKKWLSFLRNFVCYFLRTLSMKEHGLCSQKNSIQSCSFGLILWLIWTPFFFLNEGQEGWPISHFTHMIFLIYFSVHVLAIWRGW